MCFSWQDGFARFSQTRYSAEPGDVANNFMHLTNVVSSWRVAIAAACIVELKFTSPLVLRA
jgi:hypothetical protein